MLGSDALALGHLEFLWHVANETGDPVIGDAEDVEAQARWDGESGALVTALMGCGSAGGAGFIVQCEGGLYEIHDYWHHAPDYVRKRADREAKRREKSDPRQIVTGQRNDSDRSVTGQSPPNGRTPAPAPNKTIPPTPRAGGGDEFDRFWQAYPKKIGKAAAKRVWSRKRLNAKADLIVQHLEDRVRSDAQWLKNGGEFIPNPQTWLNRGGWDDEYQRVPETGGGFVC